MANETVFENTGRLFFSRDRIRELEKQINTAGINMPADSFAGYLAINVIVVTICLTLLVLVSPEASNAVSGTLKTYLGLPWLAPVVVLPIAFIVVYLSTMTLLSTYLVMKAEDRRNKVETVLPDFLMLVASDIKAGMTLDQAMWYSAKPEFGLLSTEVKSSIKGAFSGESLGSALDRLGGRFDSRVFRRTLLLLKQATATGGALTDILERTADDVRNTSIMKKEIAASLVLYEIFVLFAATIGTPFLFAVASKLIGIFEKLGPQMGSISTPSNMGGVLGAVSGAKVLGTVISSSDFFWFSIPTMFVTALISSFIVSVIRSGSRSQGMKYFPFVLGTSYLVYWLVSGMIESFFATIA